MVRRSTSVVSIRSTTRGVSGSSMRLTRSSIAAEPKRSTPWQMLTEVQLPLAMRTIMAGLNQTLMLALSMVVIAALIGGGGLGLVVNTGLGRLDVGGATAGGVGIVIPPSSSTASPRAWPSATM